MAFDADIGNNGELQYSIRSGKGKTKFRIHNATGMVYAHKGFEPGQEYELNVCICCSLNMYTYLSVLSSETLSF